MNKINIDHPKPYIDSEASKKQKSCADALGSSCFKALPFEIRDMVLSYCDSDSLKNVRATCKEFRTRADRLLIQTLIHNNKIDSARRFIVESYKQNTESPFGKDFGKYASCLQFARFWEPINFPFTSNELPAFAKHIASGFEHKRSLWVDHIRTTDKKWIPIPYVNEEGKDRILVSGRANFHHRSICDQLDKGPFRSVKILNPLFMRSQSIINRLIAKSVNGTIEKIGVLAIFQSKNNRYESQLQMIFDQNHTYKKITFYGSDLEITDEGFYYSSEAIVKTLSFKNFHKIKSIFITEICRDLSTEEVFFKDCTFFSADSIKTMKQTLPNTTFKIL